MAKHWRDFSYEQWQKEDAEFDWEKWKRESDAYLNEVFSQDPKGPSAPIKATAPEKCPWKPTPFYNVEGDQIEFYFADEMYHGEWLCPGSELLISEETGEVIGVVIPGIKRMIAKAIAENEASFMDKVTTEDVPVKNS